MAIEIERKFLITSEKFKKEAYSKEYIKQGFLNSDKNRVVRVRVINKKAFLTIKGKTNSTGLLRFEWEKEILLDEAKELLKLCENIVIEKNRFLVKSENHIFEVDEFLFENKGLIIAEVELASEDEFFLKPDWLGREVTGLEKYYNSNLSKHPFNKWRQ